MIEINLTQPELRKKRKGAAFGGINIPMEIIVGSAGGLLILLIFVHVGLLGLNIMRIGQHKNLKAQWGGIEPQKQEVDGVINQMRTLQTKYGAVEKIIGEDRISWAQKLNIISDVIPRGVWLKKIALSDNVFFLDGSAIDKVNDEMTNIHNFTSNLKLQGAFLDDFRDLELGTIQRRKVQNVEVADFIISADIEIETEIE